ncbi:hypothetical protein KCP77_14160 [Salmonella enterica subsp. enterica]|nr:hypothetical protein KCP77_14160 [Salmonella enterica subsp. enterica]
MIRKRCLPNRDVISALPVTPENYHLPEPCGIRSNENGVMVINTQSWRAD